MALKQNEGAGSSKVITPEQHEQARKAAQARKRANKGRGTRVEPLLGGETRVNTLTLTQKRERAEKRLGKDHEAIKEIEQLLHSGVISDARKPQVVEKLKRLREKVAGQARF